MDFLDFFENIGWGLGIIVVVVVILLLIMFLSMLIPTLFMIGGRLFLGLIILILIIAVIYFIGRFAKDFIKK